MRLPELYDTNKQKKQTIDFRGYNHTANINEGEFYEMSNLSSSLYPVLSPRKTRGTVKTLTTPNGLFSKNGLIWVDGTNFSYNDAILFQVADSKKQFVSMVAYVLIFPDKMYFNTETLEHGYLESQYTSTTVGTIAGSTIDGTYMNETSSLYAKITAPGIGNNFKQYDGVTITGCSDPILNKTVVIQAIAPNYIVIAGKIAAGIPQAIGLNVARKVPDMDFLTESENRVFGCSSEKHEVYVSKLGDPWNWNCFEGISTDSYTATIGSDGDFTGAITYLGYVLFMKEDCVHKLHGSKPSNYQIFNNSSRGVAKGCEKSLVIVNETLYYMSRNGIVAYEGNMPGSISGQFGEDSYSDSVAGCMGDKYYISMRKGTKWNLFVYDEKMGMWYREDSTQAMYFTSFEGQLYYIDTTTKKLMTVVGSDPEIIKWYGEFSDYQEKSMNKKYVSRLQFLVELVAGSMFEAEIMYDNSGIWKKLTTITGLNKRTYNVPIMVRRCDFYKIKISGIGHCKLFSMIKTFSEGSDT